jgi:hypothetical protein
MRFCISSGRTLAATITAMINKSESCSLTLSANTQEKSDRLTTGISAFFISMLLFTPDLAIGHMQSNGFLTDV